MAATARERGAKEAAKTAELAAPKRREAAGRRAAGCEMRATRRAPDSTARLRLAALMRRGEARAK
jgi:hypothetical protein